MQPFFGIILLVAYATKEDYMNRITRWISLLERCTMEYRSNEICDIDISPCHHVYIYCLCNNPGVSQENLTQMIHINKSNVTRSLKILQDQGYIYKKTDESDKRILRIYPTEKAFDLLPKLREKMQCWNEVIMDGLTEEEQILLYNLLKKTAINACNYTNKKYVEVDN